MSDDPLSALEAIRERVEQVRQAGAIVTSVVANTVSMDDAPRLLAAIDAALSHHTEAVIEDCRPPFRYCSRCSGHPKWPCPEVQAITRELTREGGTDG